MNAFNYVDFHCDSNHLDNDSLVHSLLEMSKEQNARFSSSPQEFRSSLGPYLNYQKFWVCRNPRLRKERKCVALGRLGGGVERGLLLEIVQEWVSLWAIRYFLILAELEIPQKSFLKLPKSLEGLPPSTLPLLQAWVLARVGERIMWKGKRFNRKLPRYLRIVKRGLPLME